MKLVKTKQLLAQYAISAVSGRELLKRPLNVFTKAVKRLEIYPKIMHNTSVLFLTSFLSCFLMKMVTADALMELVTHLPKHQQQKKQHQKHQLPTLNNSV
ncbi:hypothetical protein KJ652_03250 [Patescibacteria group bacterium]|nr:hypothetical protein [Patescibacteria group bacterium]MBU1123584.1 hypothetical protein [Patescibacteria group bacterium]MBU1911779.1 hypothetical protein [Patescibacteria group bacterium]